MSFVILLVMLPRGGFWDSRSIHGHTREDMSFLNPISADMIENFTLPILGSFQCGWTMSNVQYPMDNVQWTISDGHWATSGETEADKRFINSNKVRMGQEEGHSAQKINKIHFHTFSRSQVDLLVYFERDLWWHLRKKKIANFWKDEYFKSQVNFPAWHHQDMQSPDRPPISTFQVVFFPSAVGKRPLATLRPSPRSLKTRVRPSRDLNLVTSAN